MAGLHVEPLAGSPFGIATPLQSGMPPTMMDPFRKCLLVPQAQPQCLPALQVNEEEVGRLSSTSANLGACPRVSGIHGSSDF